MQSWAADSPSDLEWKGLGNYGTDSGVGCYLINRDGTCDYGGGTRGPSEIEAYEGFGKEDLISKSQGQRNALTTNFGENAQGQAENGFDKMKTIFGNPSERGQNSEERQSRLSKIEGVNSKGDFEQRRHGRNPTENKPAFFERGNTDRFKAQCLIWPAKTKRCAITKQATGNIGGGRK